MRKYAARKAAVFKPRARNVFEQPKSREHIDKALHRSQSSILMRSVDGAKLQPPGCGEGRPEEVALALLLMY
jgi:hypothetical protein